MIRMDDKDGWKEGLAGEKSYEKNPPGERKKTIPPALSQRALGNRVNFEGNQKTIGFANLKIACYTKIA
jgi:hypothetical protein